MSQYESHAWRASGVIFISLDYLVPNVLKVCHVQFNRPPVRGFFSDFSSFSPSWTVTHRRNSLFPIHASLNHSSGSGWPALWFTRILICNPVHTSEQTLRLWYGGLRFMLCTGDSLCLWNPATLTKREELCSAHAWQSPSKPKDCWEP